MSSLKDCPYKSSCTRLVCDYACSMFTTYDHWASRSSITLHNPVFGSTIDQLQNIHKIVRRSIEDKENDRSNLRHLSVLNTQRDRYNADLATYFIISKYCFNKGLRGGVYKLDFSDYIEEIKKSWSNRQPKDDLEYRQIWIKDCNFLVIYNLGLVKFGDFESQTLLSILQQRYEQKYTIVIIEKGSFIGKFDSPFYQRLKKEFNLRGSKL